MESVVCVWEAFGSTQGRERREKTAKSAGGGSAYGYAAKTDNSNMMRPSRRTGAALTGVRRAVM